MRETINGERAQKRPALLGAVAMALVAAFIGATESFAAQASDAAAVFDFESARQIKDWRFFNGAEFPGARGTLSLAKGAGRKGGNCARLHFDFSGGGNYVEASVALPAKPRARAVRLWLKKPGTNRLTFRSTDESGQTFQKSLRYEYGGWQQVEVDLGEWAHHWGGANDGRFHGAPRSFAILIENDGIEKVGDLLFDDVAVLASPRPRRDQTLETTYDLLAYLGKSGGWTLAYDFRGRGENRFGINRSLFGRPKGLRLVVESDGSGHELRAVIASHFQSFEKSLGALSEQGRMELTAHLGDMKEWRHYGGENDGRVRLPLRLISIGVVKKGKRATGKIRVRSIEITTQIDPKRPIVAVGRGDLVGAQTARFSLEATNLSGKAEPIETRGEIRNFEGELVGSFENASAGPIGAVPYRFSKTVPAGSAPFLEAVFRSRVAGSQATVSRATVVRPIEERGEGRLEPESPFGMGLYLYRYSNTPASLKEMDRAAALAEAAGVKWSREEFNWNRIEKERGRYDWEFYDKMVETARRHGISIYGLLAYWSRWTKPYTPEAIEDYCRFVRAVVSRYKGKIKHWEIWNEPNIFFWSGPRDMYTELLKRAYAAIKETDPEALVLGCSTAGIDARFIRRVIKLGGKFDILTIHPYRGHLDDVGFVRELRQVRELTKKIDGRPRPVWITEMGWPTSLIEGVGEREQADLLARCYVGAVGSGAVGSISWYDFRNDGDDPFYKEANFGVVRRDFSPKPAYRALATVCRRLRGAAAEGDPEIDENLVVFRFRRGSERIAAAWARRRDLLVTVSGGSAKFAAINLMGEERPLIAAGSEALLALRANEPTILCGLGKNFAIKPAPIAVSADPPAARPGERIRLRCEFAGGAAKWGLGSAVRWECPSGWKIETAGGGREATVVVPASASEGVENLWAVVGRDGKTIRLRVPIRIVPSVLKI